MTNVYDIMKLLIPFDQWKRVFYMGPSLLDCLERSVPVNFRPSNEHNFMLFVEDTSIALNIFTVDDESLFEHEDEIVPSSMYCEAGRGMCLLRRFMFRLYPRYKCTIEQSEFFDVYNIEPKFDVVLSFSDTQFMDIYRRFEYNVVNLRMQRLDCIVRLFIMSPIVYEHSVDSVTEYLSTNANRIFQMECLETFVILEDLINRVPVARLSVYSSECCAFQTSLFAYEDPNTRGLMLRDLGDPRYNERVPKNYNFTECFHFTTRVKGLRFDVFTDRPVCRSYVLREKYFYRWLRFAWRPVANGRCARRVRRFAMKWREYLYVPRFATSSVQRKWKERFECNLQRLLY